MHHEEKTYTNQMDFLEQEGFLESDDPKSIEEGKRAYRRWYKNQHRKENKKKHPEVVVILPNQEALSFIKQKAKEHGRSMSALLWEATESYLKQNYVQVQEKRWEEVQQNLMLTEMHIRMIQELAEEDSQPMSYNFQVLLEKLMDLKELVETTLNNGKKILNLTYLEFGDNVTACFTGGSFLPPSISKAEAVARLLEAYNIPPNYGGNDPYTDVDNTTPYYGYIVSAFQFGFLTGSPSTFNPYSSLTQTTLNSWLANAPSTPSQSMLQDINNYYIPGNYTPQNIAQAFGIEQGVFSHYAKNSLAIPDRKFSLNFSHYYSSFMAEMPDNMYPIKPLSKGWTHTYNIYIYFEEVNNEDLYYIVWSDGTIQIYNDDDNEYESLSVYDEFDKVTSSRIDITKKDQTIYTFRRLDSGREIFYLTKVEDRNGNELNIAYEDANEPDTKRIDYVEAPSGRRLSFDYKSNFAQYDFDLLEDVTDPIGRVIQFDYSSVSSNQLPQFEEFEDAKGNITEYIYKENSNGDATFLLEEIELPEGNRITNTYSSNSKISTHRFNNDDPITVDLTYNYSSTNQYIESTLEVPLPSGSTMDVDYEFNVDGALTSMLSDLIDFSATYPSTGINRLKPTNTNTQGVETDYSYDSDGNLTSVETESTILENYSYNSDNTLRWYQNGEGYKTYYDYDGNGNLTEIKDHNQITRMTISYDTYGQVDLITDGEGRSLDFTFTTFGMVSVVDAPLGIQFSFTYDGVNRMTSFSHNGRVHSYQYDANDNVTLYSDPANVTTIFSYDDNDNLTQVTNGNNNDINLSYTNEDRLNSENFEGLLTDLDYNDDGTIDNIEKPSGIVLDFQYDNDGRLEYSEATGFIDYDANENIIELDRNGIEIDLDYDNFNRLSEVIDRSNQNHTIEYDYDLNHNIERIKYDSSPNIYVLYDYDERDRIDQVHFYINGQLKKIADYSYNNADQVLNKIYGEYNGNNLIQANSTDGAGRINSIMCSSNTGGLLYRVEYDYNVWNNITQKTYFGDTIAGTPAFTQQGTITYSYDDHNFITQVGTTTPSVNADGNSVTLHVPVQTQFVYSDVDELILISPPFAGSNSIFEYDGFGHRRKAIRFGVETRYVWDVLNNRVAYETNGSGAVQYFYVYGVNGELLCRVKPSGETQYYHGDLTGNVLFMTDENQNVVNQYEYDDFGTVVLADETEFNRYRHVGIYGVEYETQDLYYMRARYYVPSLGRFLTEDPVWSTNLYPYVGNNPISRIDPSGEFFETIADVASLGLSVVEMVRNPSLANAGFLVWDAVALIPGVPGSWIGRGAKMLSKADNFVDAAKTGWKVGEPITNLTAKGNVPVWSTVRQRFWKNEALLNSGEYATINIPRMQKGLAPQRINPSTGVLESMELHHHIVPQRNGGLFDFIKVWPDEHRAIDPFRR